MTSALQGKSNDQCFATKSRHPSATCEHEAPHHSEAMASIDLTSCLARGQPAAAPLGICARGAADQRSGARQLDDGGEGASGSSLSAPRPPRIAAAHLQGPPERRQASAGLLRDERARWRTDEEYVNEQMEEKEPLE